MWFVLIGVLLGALKLLDVAPVAEWSWWGVLSPFPLAALWWWWADASGYTRRKEMDKMDERKVARRRKSLEALGLDHRAFDKQQKKAAAFKSSRQRSIDRVEGKREAQRQKLRDSILQSRFQSSQMSEQDPDTTPSAKAKQ
jgi:small Trp-rich protein